MSKIESFVRFCESDFGTAIMGREAAYVKRHVSADETILDVGCGIGSLEERFGGYDITGVDRSIEMVRTARDRANARFLCGDARALPIRTDVVDAVVFLATLTFTRDLDAVLSEATRVLDSEGTFVALVLNTQSEYVQSNLQREGSYFQQMVHRDSGQVVDRIDEYVDGTQEYILGIENETVVERVDPSTAALTAVVGTPA